MRTKSTLMNRLSGRIKSKFVRHWLNLNPPNKKPEKGSWDDIWAPIFRQKDEEYNSAYFGFHFLYSPEVQRLIHEINKRELVRDDIRPPEKEIPQNCQ